MELRWWFRRSTPHECTRSICRVAPTFYFSLQQHARNGSRHQVGHGSGEHGTHTQAGQFAFLIRSERSNTADLYPDRTQIGEPAESEGGNRERSWIEQSALGAEQRECDQLV